MVPLTVDSSPDPALVGVVVLMRAAIMDQEARLAATEARERTAGLHDPVCPWWQRELAQRMAGYYITPVDCDCWLNE